MGLIEKVTAKAVSTPVSKYTSEEYEFLFALIKNCTFKGENLELLYNLTVKLQEDYLLVKK